MSTLTKRHYVFIAKVINGFDDMQVRDVVRRHFSRALSSDNRRFDEPKFRKACLEPTFKERYIVTAWNGEYRNVYYVVDTAQPESVQPFVISSTESKFDATEYCAAVNLLESTGGAT